MTGVQTCALPIWTLAAEVLAMKPDGVFLSNGPGDPEPCDYAIAAIRVLNDPRIKDADYILKNAE